MALILNPHFHNDFDLVELHPFNFDPSIFGRHPCAPRRVQRFHPMACFDFPLRREHKLARVSNGREDFEVSMNLREFKKENIKIEVNPGSNILTVSAKNEDEHSIKEIKRSYLLPKECKAEDVKTKFDQQGKLTVKVAKKALEQEAAKEAIKADESLEKVSESTESALDAKEKDEVMEVEVHQEDKAKSEAFVYEINMEGFKPDEIVVSVGESGEVLVAAKHEEELEDGSFNSSEVKRKVLVDPSKFDIENISSNLDKSGKMTVSVPPKEN